MDHNPDECCCVDCCVARGDGEHKLDTHGAAVSVEEVWEFAYPGLPATFPMDYTSLRERLRNMAANERRYFDLLRGVMDARKILTKIGLISND